MKKIEIFKVTPDKEEKTVDVVTGEVPLTIYVNDEEIVTLLSSPSDLRELAVGFLFTSSLINKFDEIAGITVDKERWVVYLDLKDKNIDSTLLFKRLFTSGCGRGTLFYNAADIIHKEKKRSAFKVERDRVFGLMKDFQTRSKGFMETGGVHSAALADGEKIIVFMEDIGRHNALDKIIGHALMNGIMLKDKIVFSSGRISSEILLKVQKTDISMIISRSAPTDQAIKHAEKAGITLVGFVRGERMNVYNGMESII